MSFSSKRLGKMDDNSTPKRIKKECSYGEACYRLNPAHFREYSHPHLEQILENYDGTGEYDVPEKYSLQKAMIVDQLNVIVEKQLYERKNKKKDNLIVKESCSNKQQQQQAKTEITYNKTHIAPIKNEPNTSQAKNIATKNISGNTKQGVEIDTKSVDLEIARRKEQWEKSGSQENKVPTTVKDSDYRPVVPPVRRIEEYFKVVRPSGGMAAKHSASAPYHIFYTTITDSKETHSQPYSITFQEILDRSLGELQCSLQINFMVDVSWLLAHYYFAGYSAKKLTILYGEDSSDLRDIGKKKPHVRAHRVTMATPFGKHHTKMMILCYEDGSLRVVVSTANLYLDDWENRTQGLWFSPRCPPLPPGSTPDAGESPTVFKRSLLKYLHEYRLADLAFYLNRVKACDFSHINVFLVSSVPGSHSDLEWGLTRVGALLRQHCCIPPDENARWPLIAQASSLGSFGKEPKLWLTGDFLLHFSKVKDQPAMLGSSRPELKLVYPSLENVKQSHDGLLGGGCLPYSADVNSRQPWLVHYLYQWRATFTGRDKAMPHIKSYMRISADHKSAGFYLLTSGNVSKAAWGTINVGNRACRIMSYEAGVLLLPKFVINKEFFPLLGPDRLLVPYDLPPTKYTQDMTPWVSDYLY